MTPPSSIPSAPAAAPGMQPPSTVRDAVGLGTGRAPAPAPAFRPEIQGLRSLAVLLVAAYHIWFGRVSGGVDVFLFISAFLMTLSFTRRIERGERIGWRRLSTYWVHVFKRILPLAVLTVLLVLVGTRALLGPERWLPILRESVSVLTYWENWYSIAHAVDYYAADSGAASPLRHFWSLSVQGQIFLTWPLLFALGALIIRGLRLPARAVLGTLFGLVFAASLAFSVILTSADQQSAYFNTFARLWEFALGSLLAILLPLLRAPARVRAGLGWIGVAAILLCGAVLDVQGAFPGWIALWPTLAASLVIFAGQTGTRWGADRLLSWGPLVRLGGYSYALYLLHWPLLVFYLSHVGQEKAGFVSGVGLVALSLAGAVALTRWVDAPLRSWRWAEAGRWRSLAVIGLCLCLGLGSAGAWWAHIDRQEQRLVSRGIEDYPGARVLYAGAEASDASPIPVSAKRNEDTAKPLLGESCAKSGSWSLHGLARDQCFYSVRQEHPSRTVVAVGNSHTEQWMVSLIHRAQERNEDLIFIRQVGCFFTTVADNWFAEECQEWLPRAEALIQEISPDQLFIQSTFTAYGGGGESIRAGTEEQVRRWTGRGVQVIGIRDNARFARSHAQCEREQGLSECVFDHVTARTADPTRGWQQSIGGYGAVDMDDLICPDGGCPPVIGNVYTYRDDNHLTATYIRSMQDAFDERVDAAERAAAEDGAE